MKVEHRQKGVKSQMRSAPYQRADSQIVCKFWRDGRCNKNPCAFRHEELPKSNKINTIQHFDNRSNGIKCNRSNSYVRTEMNNPTATSNVKQHLLSKSRSADRDEGIVKMSQMATLMKRSRGEHNGGELVKVTKPDTPSNCSGVDHNKEVVVVAQIDMVCKHWVNGNCSYGDTCVYKHQWFNGNSFSFLTQLSGHAKLPEQAITCIAFPSGSDKVYSGSKDNCMRVWDCHTGQCARVLNMESEIACIISDGHWIFVGVVNAVKAVNTQTDLILTLDGPVGLVYSLAVGKEILLAGTNDGSILTWRAGSYGFEVAAPLKGHNRAVISLAIGAKTDRLYSGSMDHTIRVWDLKMLSCIHTLEGHSSAVTSVICSEGYLLSCSLDKTIKIWDQTDSGALEVIHTHNEEHGLLALCGINDLDDDKPVLIC